VISYEYLDIPRKNKMEKVIVEEIKACKKKEKEEK